MKLNYFKGCSTMEEVKKLYKELALANHPDRGGDTAIMQEINGEYSYVIETGNFGQTVEEKQTALIYKDLIDQIVMLEGIFIEIIGTWVWVSGQTYPVRDQLKQAGLKFSHGKKMWYYHEGEFTSYKKSTDIEDIRAKYGTTFINGKAQMWQLT